MTTNTKPLTRWRLFAEGSRWRWRLSWCQFGLARWVGLNVQEFPAWPKDGLPDTPAFDILLEDSGVELALWRSVCDGSTFWYICNRETGVIVETAYSVDAAYSLYNLKVKGTVTANCRCVISIALPGLGDQPLIDIDTDRLNNPTEPGGDSNGSE